MRQLPILKMVRFIVCFLLAVNLVGCVTPRGSAQEEKLAHRTAKINAQLGIAYLEKNNIQRSKQKLMLAIDQAPEIPEPWYSMAYFFEATGNATLADTYYKKAIAVAPTRGDAHNNYGTFLCRTGKYQAARQHFMVAVNDKDYLDPADAYENAGMCELSVPNQKLAMEYFSRALIHDPKRPISLLKMAEIEYKQKNYNLSDRYLDQYFKHTPQPENAAHQLSAKLDGKMHFQSKSKKRLASLENNVEMDDAMSELMGQSDSIT